jgi:RimJ/RimL family protein N-acetyltransferase
LRENENRLNGEKQAGMPALPGIAMRTIETARVYLRPFSSNDLDEFTLMGSDQGVMRYIGDGKPQTRAQTQMRLNAILDHWDQHGFGLCAVVDKATRAFIGFCGLQYLDNTSEIEIGYRLAKRFWGIGLATEAARASLKHGFEELGLDRVVAVVHPENVASQWVIQKIGLRYVKDARFYNSDVEYYAITRQEFEQDDST